MTTQTNYNSALVCIYSHKAQSPDSDAGTAVLMIDGSNGRVWVDLSREQLKELGDYINRELKVFDYFKAKEHA